LPARTGRLPSFDDVDWQSEESSLRGFEETGRRPPLLTLVRASISSVSSGKSSYSSSAQHAHRRAQDQISRSGAIRPFLRMTCHGGDSPLALRQNKATSSR
jgi:hypothetical protein